MSGPTRLVTAVAVALALASPALASPALAAQEPVADSTPGERLPVAERTLANGLRVLVLPRRGAPTVSFVLQYGVGSIHESPGETGTAHMLEHMLFKGTRSVGTRNPAAEGRLFGRLDLLHDSLLSLEAAAGGAGSATLDELREHIRALEDSARAHVVPNELDRILREAGARNLNAATGLESTYYYVELPSNRARLWFVLEGDRMRNPVFREFYAERDVVMEERRTRVETNPSGLLHEAHLGSAFHVHPYGRPVVGYMADLRRLTRPEVRAWYERYYRPDNAVLSIVGDVDADQILAWAEAYLGGVPPGAPPPPIRAVEPPQRGERRVDVVFDAEPEIRIGWKIVPREHPDFAPLSVLSHLLTGGRLSRLHRRLVLEERIATFVASETGPGVRFPGLFSVHAYPRFPHTTADIEEAVELELERLRAAPPSAEEIARVRNQLEAGSVRRLRSNLDLAFQLADSETLLGDWRATFRFFRELQAVTPEDVQRVVRDHLTSGNRTVAVLRREEAG